MPADVSTTGEKLIEAGKTLQRLKTEWHEAVSVVRPRDEKKVLAKALEEVSMAPEYADENWYRWEVYNHKDRCEFKGQRGRGKKPTCKCEKKIVEGGSINAAMVLGRRYGNNAVDISDEGSDAEFVRRRVTAMDFESGWSISFPVVEAKVKRTRSGSVYTVGEKQLEQTVQIATSKAIRNAYWKMLPRHMQTKIVAHAKQVFADCQKSKHGPLKDRIAKMKEVFGSVDVDEAMLKQYLGHALSKTTEDEIIALQGILRAIRDEGVAPGVAFGFDDPNATGESEETQEAEVDETTPAEVIEGAKDVTPEPEGEGVLDF